MYLTTPIIQESLPRPLDAAPEVLNSNFVDMVPGQTLEIDASNPLVEIDEAYQQPRLANVYAGNERFAVMAQRWDERLGRAVGPFFLVHEIPGVAPEDRVECANFTNSNAVVGHAQQGQPFFVDGTVDHEHFQVSDGKRGITLTNFSFSAETVMEQAVPRPKAGLKERFRAFAASLQTQIGKLAIGEVDIEGIRSRVNIRAERAESTLRRLLGGVTRLLVEPAPSELFTQEPEVLAERSRRIANAALYGVGAVPSNPAPRIHRERKWRPGNRSRYDDGVTDAVRKEFADTEPQSQQAPYGYFRNTNFALIGRDSPTVRGGVYVSRGHEALLVDHRSPQMQEAASEMRQIVLNMHLESGAPSDEDILWAVRNYTQLRLPYRAQEYDNLVRPLLSANGIMPISELLDREMAICNGQAPFAAFLVEDLIESGLLHGVVSVERKIDKRSGIGHATIAFDPFGNTDPDRVLVVDLSGREGYVGTRDGARRLGYWYVFDLPAAA